MLNAHILILICDDLKKLYLFYFLPQLKRLWKCEIRVCDSDVTYVVPTEKEEGGDYVASRESRS